MTSLRRVPLLVCAATPQELGAYALGVGGDAELFLSGVGVPLTLTRLMRRLSEGRPDAILNVGIAGAALAGLLGPDWWVRRRHKQHLDAIQAGLPRKPIQFFVGAGKWDDEAVMAELRRHVRQEMAAPTAS